MKDENTVALKTQEERGMEACSKDWVEKTDDSDTKKDMCGYDVIKNKGTCKTNHEDNNDNVQRNKKECEKGDEEHKVKMDEIEKWDCIRSVKALC